MNNIHTKHRSQALRRLAQWFWDGTLVMMDLMCRTFHDFLVYTLQDHTLVSACLILYLAFDHCAIPSLHFIQLGSHVLVMEQELKRSGQRFRS